MECRTFQLCNIIRQIFWNCHSIRSLPISRSGRIIFSEACEVEHGGWSLYIIWSSKFPLFKPFSWLDSIRGGSPFPFQRGWAPFFSLKDSYPNPHSHLKILTVRPVTMGYEIAKHYTLHTCSALINAHFVYINTQISIHSLIIVCFHAIQIYIIIIIYDIWIIFTHRIFSFYNNAYHAGIGFILSKI